MKRTVRRTNVDLVIQAGHSVAEVTRNLLDSLDLINRLQIDFKCFQLWECWYKYPTPRITISVRVLPVKIGKSMVVCV